MGIPQILKVCSCVMGITKPVKTVALSCVKFKKITMMTSRLRLGNWKCGV